MSEQGTRLQKYLAQCGVAARRKCENLIAQGRVAVNGQIVTEMGTRVLPEDIVTVDGEVVCPEAQKHYILYYKPIGEVTTVSDPGGRATVMDRFEGFPARLFPVGRLDFDSEGLLLLTNDGALAQRMLHPGRQVDKGYLVRAGGDLSDKSIHALRQGVLLDGRMTSPAQVRVIRRTGQETVLQLTIHEGRNRQVRRMIEAVGHPVFLLRRVRFGPLQLGGLARGKWRELTDEEIEALRTL